MSLKAVVASLDEVDDQYHDLYEERDGKYALKPIEGLKTEADVQRVQLGLKKERDAHSATKEKLRVYGEFGAPEELRTKLERVEELELLGDGKVDEAKIGALVETRAKAKIAPLERENAQLKETIREKDTLLADYGVKEVKGSIERQVRSAATGKLRDTAIDDALLLAETVLVKDESGELVVRAGTQFTEGVGINVFLTEAIEKRPHWLLESVGGNARGGKGGGSVANPWKKDSWNLTEQGKILTADRSKAEQLAKSAGTTIGGPRPEK